MAPVARAGAPACCARPAERILLPFIVGMAAAYVLDPLADGSSAAASGAAPQPDHRLLHRLLALLLLVLLPVAVEQAVGLAAKLPGYFDELRARILTSSSGSSARTSSRGRRSRAGVPLRPAGAQLCRHGGHQRCPVEPRRAQPRLAGVHHAHRDLLSPARLGPHGGGGPRRGAAAHRPTARRLARETDQVLAGFLRGQGMVCTFLAAFYAVGLVLVGLEYGAIIGLLTGVFSFIPYVGMLVGVAVGMTVAVFQFGAGSRWRWWRRCSRSDSSSRATSSPPRWSAAASACTRSG